MISAIRTRLDRIAERLLGRSGGSLYPPVMVFDRHEDVPEDLPDSTIAIIFPAMPPEPGCANAGKGE